MVHAVTHVVRGPCRQVYRDFVSGYRFVFITLIVAFLIMTDLEEFILYMYASFTHYCSELAPSTARFAAAQ